MKRPDSPMGGSSVYLRGFWHINDVCKASRHNTRHDAHNTHLAWEAVGLRGAEARVWSGRPWAPRGAAAQDSPKGRFPHFPERDGQCTHHAGHRLMMPADAERAPATLLWRRPGGDQCACSPQSGTPGIALKQKFRAGAQRFEGTGRRQLSCCMCGEVRDGLRLPEERVGRGGVVCRRGPRLEDAVRTIPNEITYVYHH